MNRLVSAPVAIVLLANAAACLGECCHHCGCRAECSKVCRVVCEMKTVTEPVYDCEHEQFCVPGKSDRCVTRDECGHRQVIYTPTCGQVRTRTRLVKRNETRQVKTYRWMVEDLCEHCASKCRTSDCTSRATAAKSCTEVVDPFSLEARRGSSGQSSTAAR